MGTLGWNTDIKDINDHQVAVGCTGSHAYRLDILTDTFTTIHPDGYWGSWASGINNSNQIVGRTKANSGGNKSHAAYWDADGNHIDIHPDGWRSSDAHAINNN